MIYFHRQLKLLLFICWMALAIPLNAQSNQGSGSFSYSNPYEGFSFTGSISYKLYIWQGEPMYHYSVSAINRTDPSKVYYQGEGYTTDQIGDAVRDVKLHKTYSFTADVYDGSSKVTNISIPNARLGMAGSANWSNILPGVSSERARDLLENGFTLRNFEIQAVDFEMYKLEFAVEKYYKKKEANEILTDVPGLIENGDLDKAEEKINEARRLDSSNPKLAELQEELEEKMIAVREEENAAREAQNREAQNRQSNSGSAASNQASNTYQSAYQQRKEQEAEKEAISENISKSYEERRKSASSSEEKWELYIEQGQSYERNGDYARAVGSYTAALRIKYTEDVAQHKLFCEQRAMEKSRENYASMTQSSSAYTQNSNLAKRQQIIASQNANTFNPATGTYSSSGSYNSKYSMDAVQQAQAISAQRDAMINQAATDLSNQILAIHQQNELARQQAEEERKRKQRNYQSDFNAWEDDIIEHLSDIGGSKRTEKHFLMQNSLVYTSARAYLPGNSRSSVVEGVSRGGSIGKYASSRYSLPSLNYDSFLDSVSRDAKYFHYKEEGWIIPADYAFVMDDSYEYNQYTGLRENRLKIKHLRNNRSVIHKIEGTGTIPYHGINICTVLPGSNDLLHINSSNQIQLLFYVNQQLVNSELQFDPHGQGNINMMCVSNDHQYVLLGTGIGSSRYVVTLYDLASGQKILDLPLSFDRVTDFSFSRGNICIEGINGSYLYDARYNLNTILDAIVYSGEKSLETFKNGSAIYKKGLEALYKESPDVSSAVFCLTEAREILDDPSVNIHLGKAYMQNDENEKAKKMYDELIESGYQSAELFLNRGMINYDLGNYYPAISDLKKALKADPESINPFLTIAHAYFEMGQKTRAYALLEGEIVIRTNIEHQAYMKYTLAVFHSQDGDPAEANKYLTDILETYPGFIKLVREDPNMTEFRKSKQAKRLLKKYS